MNGEELRQKVSEIMLNEGLEKALIFSYEHYPDRQVMLLLNRFSRVNKDWNKGVIPYSELQLELSRISDSLLQVLESTNKSKIYSRSKFRRYRVALFLFFLTFLDYGKLSSVFIYFLGAVTIVTGVSVIVSKSNTNPTIQSNNIEKQHVTLINAEKDGKNDIQEGTSGTIDISDISTKEDTQQSTLKDEKKDLKQGTSKDVKKDIQEKKVSGIIDMSDVSKKDTKRTTKDVEKEEKRIKSEDTKNKIISISFFGQDWNTSALDVEIAESWCPNNNFLVCNEYGRLYTWESAKKVCQTLGSDWYLPTDRDWSILLNNNGGINDPFGEDETNQSKTFQNLETLGIKINSSGSYIEGIFNRFDDTGYYWSSTEDEMNRKNAWLYSFEYKTKLIDRISDNKSYGFSCLCIKKQ